MRQPKRTSVVRVALVHGAPTAGDLAANWRVFERLARQAGRRRADICVSPECFLDGYGVTHCCWTRRQLIEAGRQGAREYLPRLKALAGELRMILVFGMTYASGGKCFNSAFLIGPGGRQIGRYDKTHLLDHDLRFDAGRNLPVFSTPIGKVGIMICADRRWPEVARTLRVQGARLIFNPTYGMCGLANEWWMRTRSYENECWICFAHPQMSLVTDPHGNIHAKRRSRRPGLLTADLNMSKLPTKMFDARRPGIYKPITLPVTGASSRRIPR